MKKITQKIVEAFYNNKNLTISNTSTDGNSIFLFGNRIAIKKLSGQEKDGLYITMAGMNTVTTRERLNGLRGVKIQTKKGKTFLNGKEWDGNYIKIN